MVYLLIITILVWLCFISWIILCLKSRCCKKTRKTKINDIEPGVPKPAPILKNEKKAMEHLKKSRKPAVDPKDVVGHVEPVGQLTLVNENYQGEAVVEAIDEAIENLYDEVSTPTYANEQVSIFGRSVA